MTLARTGRAVLDGDLAGQRDQAGLGRAVGRVALGADEAEDRRGVDDRARPRPPACRDRRPAGPEDGVEVGGDGAVPLLLGAVDEPARHLHGGVVVEHVEAAERSTVAATIASTVGRDANVGADDRRLAALGLDQRAVSAAPSSSMSTMRSAPCRANSSAAARPCPEAAPVISATCPSSSRSSASGGRCGGHRRPNQPPERVGRGLGHRPAPGTAGSGGAGADPGRVGLDPVVDAGPARAAVASVSRPAATRARKADAQRAALGDGDDVDGQAGGVGEGLHPLGDPDAAAGSDDALGVDARRGRGGGGRRSPAAS